MPRSEREALRSENINQVPVTRSEHHGLGKEVHVSEMDVNSGVLKYHWFSTFSISSDGFRDYKYETLLFPTPVKIISLTQLNGDFFDWRYHFELEATSTVNNERYNLQAVLNESNVFDCFFDPKVPKELFGHDQLSPLVRYCESRL